MSLVSISACLVIHNEEAVLDRCLKSISGLANEIVVVHDGECTDKSLEIARQYTDKIYIRDHIGEAEPHRAFSFEKASGDWILQMDADEYLDSTDHEKIRTLFREASSKNIDAFIFNWELWNGSKAVTFKGLQKMCLFYRKHFSFVGVPHEAGNVIGNIQKVPLFLRHRPSYNNLLWSSFYKKAKKWVPVHAKYFFPEKTKYECFNTTPDKWIAHVQKVRKHIMWYLIFEPLKMLAAQLKNGLITSWAGVNIALQQYVYYVRLYWTIWKMERQK